MKETNGQFAVHEGVSEKEEAITPHFDTKDELVEHLIKNGTDWDDPISRRVANKFVHETPYVPSAAFMNGRFLKGFEILAQPTHGVSDDES